tara:strand:+ start:28 stop:237 length:210 start_codon:yes stop_codon:yes gene_type:complete
VPVLAAPSPSNDGNDDEEDAALVANKAKAPTDAPTPILFTNDDDDDDDLLEEEEDAMSLSDSASCPPRL